MSFVLRTIVNAAALWLAAYLVPGITLAENEPSAGKKLGTILIVALIFGLVNALVRPLATVLGCAFIVLTLGLFIFVINAAMLLLTSKLAGELSLEFHVADFWPSAVVGSIIISLASWALSVFLPDEERDKAGFSSRR